MSLSQVYNAVTPIFTVAAVGTGLQGVLSPHSFSRTFGIPIRGPATAREDPACAYVSLMGVRQLATGLIVLQFAYRQKWEEAATVLATIGVLVAGTDGWFLALRGDIGKGIFHALPGFGIAALAGSALYYGV